MKLQQNLFDLTYSQEKTSKMMYNKIIKCLVAPYHTQNSLSIDYAPNIFMFPEKELSHMQTKNFVSMLVNSNHQEALIITSSIDIILDMVDDCVRILTEYDTIVDCPEKTFCANQHSIIFNVLDNKAHKKSSEEKSLYRQQTSKFIDKINSKVCTQDEYEEISNFVDNVGEQIIRTKLKEMMCDMTIVNKFSGMNDDCIEFMKTMDYYINNDKISDCIDNNDDYIKNLSNVIRITNELLSLLYNDKKKYSKEIKNHEKDLAESKKEDKMCQTINEWLNKQKKNTKIQTLIK